jgi:hypothetical protein
MCTINRKETNPDEKCEKFYYEDKPRELHHAVERVSQLYSMERFGKAMNGEVDNFTELAKLEKDLAAMRMKLEAEQADKNKAPTLSSDLLKQVDNVIEKQVKQAAPGDVLMARYKIPLVLVASFNDDFGNSTGVVLRKPNGDYILLDQRECEFAKASS